MPVEKSQMMSLSGEQTKNKEEKQIQQTNKQEKQMQQANDVVGGEITEDELIRWTKNKLISKEEKNKCNKQTTMPVEQSQRLISSGEQTNKLIRERCKKGKKTNKC